MKILVADDDAVSCRMMQRMLERNGYEVILASDGRAASLELMKSTGAKLALVDWMMPELDGPGVCREVRRRSDGSYVYIVLLTSKQSHEDIVEGLEAGADDYLTKPCNPAELKARLLTGRRILELEKKLVEAHEDMRLRAMYDGLTKLLNHATILCRLRQALDLFLRESTPFSTLLCDIDHFKRINDVYGHVAGDAILEQFAGRLQKAIGPHDSVGRYGGEEFLIVLNGCKNEDLSARAEQIRRAIIDIPFGVPEKQLSVSASFGGTTVDAHDKSLLVKLVIERADKALYQAKADGRNCIRIAAWSNPLLADSVISSQPQSLFSSV